MLWQCKAVSRITTVSWFLDRTCSHSRTCMMLNVHNVQLSKWTWWWAENDKNSLGCCCSAGKQRAHSSPVLPPPSRNQSKHTTPSRNHTQLSAGPRSQTKTASISVWATILKSLCCLHNKINREVHEQCHLPLFETQCKPTVCSGASVDNLWGWRHVIQTFWMGYINTFWIFAFGFLKVADWEK